MKKYLSLYSLILLCLLLFPSNVISFDGPLSVRNHFPLFLHANTPALESAKISRSFSARLSYSSIHTVRSSARWSVSLDMEIAEFAFRYTGKISDSFGFGIEIPLFSFNSGVLDSFLESYHDMLGLPDYGRSERPRNDFLYEVRKDGKMIIKGNSGKTGIGDVRLSLKKVVYHDDPVISIKTAIELPTGNESHGFGNGSPDFMGSLLIDKRLSERLLMYGNAGMVFPGNLKAKETIDLKEYFYAGIGIEAAAWEKLHLLGQLFVQTSPFPETDISAVDRTAVMISLGGRYAFKDNSIEFSFTEDPSTSGAPDFTASLLFKKKL